MSETYSKGERRLALLTLIRTSYGVTRLEATSRIPAYSEYKEETRRRTFERDIKALRASGYPIISSDSYTYSYDSSMDITVSLTGLDAGMIAALLAGVGKADGALGVARRGLAKILATGESVSSAASYLVATIPDGDAVVSVAQAIQAGQRIRFAYTGAQHAEYECEPARIAVHYDHFYVSGLARGGTDPWEARTFRVSRMSDVRFMGDALFEPPPAADAYFTAENATVLLRRNSGTSLAAWGELVATGERLPDSDAGMSGSRASDVVAPTLRSTDDAPATFASDVEASGAEGGARPLDSRVGAAPGDGWFRVQLPRMAKNHVFEALAHHPGEAVVEGELGREWAERVRHLASLGDAS